ncbi:MAG: ATP-binding cassette domain-containing protein [Thermoflavifilum sp.]|uniref:ABC transporter ATP-binding protein n=1 Tax=Thermoflavifilum sp. TaxID=1968839 RepID=UPI0018A365E8|nr:ATP-binding cassette domain-containing protein [Thermoflavifilum sp.]QOR74949.1 MAG: ATP-binding cassette domain-containing protein [Thermoflavifilum sp.]
MAFLSLRHLKKYYDQHRAVDDFSLDMEKGNIWGLLGPNGAGKTTLLRMVTGIIFPDAGEIFFRDKPFYPERDQAYMGYMPEERGLYKKMAVGEQLIYLGQLKGLSAREAKNRAWQWVQKMELTAWWSKHVGDLSKGMSQKVQFIATVLHEPELIILDEPFSGLDPINANLIRDEIFSFSKKGCLIIFSTHRMEQVEEICDHIVLINRGVKLLEGETFKIRQQFKQQQFSIKTYPLLQPDDFSGNEFTIISSSADRYVIQLQENISPNTILQKFIQQGYQILEFTEVLPSLSEIFIKTVQQQQAIFSSVETA